MRRIWLGIGVLVSLTGAVWTALTFPEPALARWLMVATFVTSAIEFAVFMRRRARPT